MAMSWAMHDLSENCIPTICWPCAFPFWPKSRRKHRCLREMAFAIPLLRCHINETHVPPRENRNELDHFASIDLDGRHGETQMNFHSICVLDKWFNAMSRQKFNVFVSVCYCIRIMYTDSELCYVLMDSTVEQWSFSRTSLVFVRLNSYFLCIFCCCCFCRLRAHTNGLRMIYWRHLDMNAHNTHSTRQSTQASMPCVLCA